MGDLANLDFEIGSFKAAFCPFGELDINMAVLQAVAAGFDGDWAFEHVDQFCEDCGLRIADVDPCYIVMDSILQFARNEIEELSGFDVCNDADFYVYGNFMCSSFESSSEDRESLRFALLPFSSQLDGLSNCARYWLKEVEIVID